MGDGCAHIVVKGLVQGVGYRYFASRRAVQLGLTGFVRNLPDGRVELWACGDRGLISEFIALLRVGPRGSRVNDLGVEWGQPMETYDKFEIR